MKILFICTDNYCRSVTAEYCLRDYLVKNNIKGVEVSSAGIDANSDTTGYSFAHFEEMKKWGIDATGHHRRQVTEELLKDADFVIIFDFKQKDFFDKYFINKVILFNELYLGEEKALNFKSPEFLGRPDEEATFVARYIHDAIPKVWSKILSDEEKIKKFQHHNHTGGIWTQVR